MGTSNLTPLSTSGRIHSIDILRGLIMVLMAIDHVRVYSGIPAWGTTADIFFTRWITHFCAPGFAFFAGCSAFLYLKKTGSKSALQKFLLTRGILLVLLELTLIRFAWTFNLNYGSFTLAGVIWMLGWCMVLLSFFVGLKPSTVAIIGFIIMAGQQVFHYVPNLFPASVRDNVSTIWNFFYPAATEPHGPITILYVLLPWLGVMMCGYGFGLILLKQPTERKKICLWIGLSAIAIFLVAASIAANGEDKDKSVPFIFRLLNQNKYPPSQLYLLMTLGPLITLVSIVESAKSGLSKIFALFGSVPMFYYIMHIFVIHISALAVNYFRLGNIHGEWYDHAPYAEVPEQRRWMLSTLYLVFLCDVIILYAICKSYSKYKKSHPKVWWLRYL